MRVAVECCYVMAVEWYRGVGLRIGEVVCGEAEYGNAKVLRCEVKRGNVKALYWYGEEWNRLVV